MAGRGGDGQGALCSYYRANVGYLADRSGRTTLAGRLARLLQAPAADVAGPKAGSGTGTGA